MVEPQSAQSTAPGIAFAIPDRIRTSQAVNLAATSATISTSAGPVPLTRNGDQFVGSINVESGSDFTFRLTISENVGGQEVVYVTATGETDQAVTADFTYTFNVDNFEYPDDDGDGATNLEEIEAGSNHQLSSSTPANPSGTPVEGTSVEAAPGVVQFANSTYTAAENDGTLTLSVTRVDGSDGSVAVSYQLRSETATVGRDFNAASGVLTWEDGDTTANTIEVTLRQDTINDGEQTFTAHLFSPSGGVAIGQGFARITLQDSTPPPQRGSIRLTSNSITVDESTGFAELTVERVGGSDGLVTIDYSTIEGTATNGDFTPVSGQTVRWADGEDGPRTIRIRINGDSQIEPAETFTVNLSNTLGGADLGLATTTITISDSTPVPVPGQLSLTPGSYIVSEGSSINITVARTGGSDGAISVSYGTGVGSANALDFTPNSGTLEWPAGDSTSRTITISTNADGIEEADEQLTLTLSNATGDATLGNSTINITISDTTVVLPGTISFGTTAATVDEGSSVDITVIRTGGTSGAVSVNVTAAASSDYTVTPSQLSWGDGDGGEQSITVSAAADDIVGDTETFSITLAGANVAAGVVNVTINDATVITGFVSRPTDGEWEVCIAPYSTSGPTAFATQLSPNEGRIVSCVKTCPGEIILDEEFEGWGWNQADRHSCVQSTDPGGTYTMVPVYTPQRERLNVNINAQRLIGNDSIWSCVTERRQNAEYNYVADQSNTIWFQFLSDLTYYYGTSPDGSQPAELLGPAVWSVNGRVLELGHIDVGYRNTLFYPGNQTLHIHPTTDDRLSCTREERVTVPEVTLPEVVIPEVTTPEVTTPEVTTPEITDSDVALP